MADYVDNKQFLEQLKQYRETGNKRTHNKIGEIFLLISRNLLNKGSFINYTQDRKDEMVSDAVFFMCRYIDRYDLEKTNPFAYFTRVAYHAFIQNINDYNKRDAVFSSIEYIENASLNPDMLNFNKIKVD